MISTGVLAIRKLWFVLSLGPRDKVLDRISTVSVFLSEFLTSDPTAFIHSRRSLVLRPGAAGYALHKSIVPRTLSAGVC